MLKEELMSIHAMLSKLQERTTNETDARVLRLCRSNLEAAAEQAEAMENNLSRLTVRRCLLHSLRWRGCRPNAHFPQSAPENQCENRNG